MPEGRLTCCCSQIWILYQVSSSTLQSSRQLFCTATLQLQPHCSLSVLSVNLKMPLLSRCGYDHIPLNLQLSGDLWRHLSPARVAHYRFRIPNGVEACMATSHAPSCTDTTRCWVTQECWQSQDWEQPALEVPVTSLISHQLQ